MTTDTYIPSIEATTFAPRTLVSLSISPTGRTAQVVAAVTFDRPDGTDTGSATSAAFAGSLADDVAPSALVQGF